MTNPDVHQSTDSVFVCDLELWGRDADGDGECTCAVQYRFWGKLQSAAWATVRGCSQIQFSDSGKLLQERDY